MKRFEKIILDGRRAIEKIQCATREQCVKQVGQNTSLHADAESFSLVFEDSYERKEIEMNITEAITLAKELNAFLENVPS